MRNSQGIVSGKLLPYRVDPSAPIPSQHRYNFTAGEQADPVTVRLWPSASTASASWRPNPLELPVINHTWFIETSPEASGSECGSDRAAIDTKDSPTHIIRMGTSQIGDRRGDFLGAAQATHVIGDHVPDRAALDVGPGLTPTESWRDFGQKLFHRRNEDRARSDHVRGDTGVFK